MSEANIVRRIAAPAAIFFLGAPLCIILHECAHYGAAVAFGCDAKLHPLRVTYTGTFDNQEAADAADLWITLAGPSVHIISVLIGVSVLCVIVRRSVHRAERNSTGFWILSFLTFSGLRWLQTPFRGRASDEATISRLIGYPWYSLPLATFVVALALCMFLGWVHHRTNSSVGVLAAIPAAIVGATLWAFVIGPTLLET